MSKWLIAGLAGSLAVTLVWAASPEFKPEEAGVLTITARYVKTPPAGIDDPAWQRIAPVQVPVAGRLEMADVKGTVSTKALFTDGELYFLLSWEDPTRSTVKESWQFDGEKWVHLKGDEDRIALLFEINRINQFSSKSCAVVCHSPADLPRDQWKLATRSPSEKGDLWHWKAARSAPYRHADDGWLTVAGNPSGSYRETGRRYDTGSGGDIKNETPDGSRPLYMQDPARNPSVSGFLLLEEAVPIADYSVFKAGDVIPYRLPVKPSGSRFDVKADSRHADGRWTVMLHRKFNTGQEDDVVFDVRKRFSFAIAVFDDTGGDHSKATRSLSLNFKR
jgi:hypothetical protein